MSCGGSGTTINYPLNVNVTLDQPLAGDGSSIGNLNASNLAFGTVSSLLIPGSALTNINASNISSGHISSLRIYGNTLSNISASNIVGTVPSAVFGNLVSNINASNIAYGHISGSLIYGNTLSNINASNIVGTVPSSVFGNLVSNVNASNIAFGIVSTSLIYGNTLSNINASNVVGVVTSGNTLSNINASNIAFGLISSSLIYGNTLSNINASNISGAFSGTSYYATGNAFISNALVTTNVIVTGNASGLFLGTFSGSAFTGGSFQGSTMSGTTITAGTGFSTAAGWVNAANFTGGAFSGTSYYATGNAYISNALTTTNVFASTVNTTNPVSFRNRVINGDFYIDQRNSGGATTPSVDGKPAIDRWKINIAGSGRCQVGQNLGSFASPTGFTSYFGMKVTTSNTVGASDYFFVSQVIEGVNTIDWMFGTSNARPVTLSFWVQSSLSGTAGGFVRNSGTSGGNYSRSYPFTFTINNTLTWEYKTITIPGDTTGTWYNGQTDGIEFGIELWNGTTWQSSPGAWAAGNYTGPSGGTINYAGTLNSYLNITGIQVELGTVATPWERRHYGIEFAACQRYYEVTIARMGGYNTAGNYLRNSVYFNTKKRPATSPTFTVISTLETSNMGSLSFDNSNFDGSSARILVPVTATGDAYGQWKVSVDCEF